MSKTDDRLIQVLENAYKTCIVGGASREYNMMSEDGLIFEVGTIAELQVIKPGINQSMVLHTIDNKGYVVCIAKENILCAPEEYRLQMLLFIVLHELGHISNGDEWEIREEENTIQEKRADIYAVERSGISPEDAAKCIEFVYKDIEESPFFPNKTEEFYGILNRMKAARIENVLSLKNKGCA